MFHRVKSEAQDIELENQEQPEKAYDKDDERQSQEEEVMETREEESNASSPRKYGYTPLKTQEEKTEMKDQKEESVQGKYAPAKNEREEETSSQRVSSYQPSITRPSYTGSSYGSASTRQKTETMTSSLYGGSADRTLTIGRGINMSGEIDACDHLLVEGTVEAALKGAKVLDIAESGTFYGTVEIEEATIAGRFEGDITVNGRLTLKASGVITGSIAYRELEVEAGAVLDGRMTPLKGEVSQKSIDSYRAGSEATAMAKTSIKKESNRTPVNTEGSGLFSKARASYQ